LRRVEFKNIRALMSERETNRHIAMIDRNLAIFYIIIDKGEKYQFPETDKFETIFLIKQGSGLIYSDSENAIEYKSGDIIKVNRGERKAVEAKTKTIIFEIRNLEK